jgi:putative holliday junction resolvase
MQIDRATSITRVTAVCGEGSNYNIVRALGIDVGQRRIGLAISDATRTLARPLKTIDVTGHASSVEPVAAEAARLAAEDDGLSTIVVGLPVRLDGSPSEQTTRVAAFIAELRKAIDLPVVAVDERLSSVEAESRIAEHTKDWRERKKRLDAVAAAVILQDYLDSADNVRSGT